MSAEFSRANAPGVLKEYQALLPRAKIKFVPHTEFKKRTPSTIGLIRTGDTTQYGNILVQSA
jgi:D-ribose pyranase